MATLPQAAPALPKETRVSSGSRTSYYSNYVKKCSLIYLQNGRYFIIRLSMPMCLPTLKRANEEIEELKSYYTKDYFDGIFSFVEKDTYIYEFLETLPASAAMVSGLGVVIIESDVNSIAPQLDKKIGLNTDIYTFSETEVEESNAVSKELGKLEVMDDILNFLDLDEQYDETTNKSFKELLEKFVVPRVRPLKSILKKSKTNEMSGTTYIFDRIKEFIDNHPQLDVYDNRSILNDSPQRNFSKYSRSRPDITALKNSVIIFNPVKQESLVVMAKDDVDDVDDVDDEMDPFSLTIEAKLKEGVNLAQVLAGMEKTYADIIYNGLKSVKPDKQMLPTGVVMYGMYITYSTNQCILLKTELKIGKQTEVFKSKESLSIADALNRILPILCK